MVIDGNQVHSSQNFGEIEMDDSCGCGTVFFILIGFAAVGLVWSVVSGIYEGIKAPPKVPLTPEQQRA